MMAQPHGWARLFCAVALWARKRITLWIVSATALNAAVITLVAAVVSLPGQSKANINGLILILLILLTLSVVFPVAGHIMEGRERSAEGNAHREVQIERLLAKGSARQLPRLSELTDDMLGATPTRYSINDRAPYVERPVADEMIRALLATPGPPYPFVIVWGDTKAGKSRTLAEALRGLFTRDSCDPMVVLPYDGAGLAELSRLKLTLPEDGTPALVVMDDLAPADLEALTSDVLDQVTGWAIIAATMTAQRRAEVLKTHSAVGAFARTALEQRSQQFELSSDPPKGAEKAAAERLYPEEHFDGSVAETLVGGRELVARYKASRDENPAACAVLRAAIDCSRAGLFRPITEVELRRLFPIYLHTVRADLAPTNKHFRDGLEWAARPVASQVALLRRTNPDGAPGAWRILDHAVTADEGGEEQPSRMIPAEAWTELIDMITGHDAIGVGFAAIAHDNIPAAISALKKGSVPGIDGAPLVTVALGALLAEHGDKDGARAAFQRAIESGGCVFLKGVLFGVFRSCGEVEALDGVLVVAGEVVLAAVAFLVGPHVVVEVAVDDDGAELEDDLGAVGGPSRAGDAESVFDAESAGALDHAGGDGQPLARALSYFMCLWLFVR